MLTSIAGRSVVVTGASRGIGKGIARVFAAKGAQVLVVARNSGPAEATAAARVRLKQFPARLPSAPSFGDRLRPHHRSARHGWGRLRPRRNESQKHWGRGRRRIFNGMASSFCAFPKPIAVAFETSQIGFK